MAVADARRAYQLFHLALAGGLLFAAVETLIHAFADLRGGHIHLAVVAGIQAVCSLLLLLPRTVRLGGAVLLLIVLVGFADHVTRGEWRVDLLVYAAGVWLVMVRRPAWGGSPAGVSG